MQPIPGVLSVGKEQSHYDLCESQKESHAQEYFPASLSGHLLVHHWNFPLASNKITYKITIALAAQTSLKHFSV